MLPLDIQGQRNWSLVWLDPQKQTDQTPNLRRYDWKSKDYFLNGFSVKTIVLVGIYNQQFKGTILFMVFDFQGYDWMSRDTIYL